MSRWKKNVRKSIAWKLVWILVLLIAPFNLAALYIAAQSLDNAASQVLQSMEGLANLAMQQLDDRMDSMDGFLFSMAGDREDFSIYSRQGERDTDYYLAETSLAQYMQTSVENMSVADGFFWYSQKYDDTFLALVEIYGRTAVDSLYLKQGISAWLHENADRYAQWSLVEIEGSQWVIRICNSDNFYYGALFSLDNLEDTVRGNAAFSDLQIQFDDGSMEPELPADCLSAASVSNSSDLRMILSIPRSEAYASLPGIQILCLAMVCLYLLLLPVLLCIMRGMVIKPLRRIRSALVHLKNGEQDYRIPEKKSSEEFEKIDATFNSMADRISTLRIENYEKELEKQKMELMNLQLQIRPHFLMNMFNLLYSFAQIESYTNIQKLSLYLSDYFRHIFQNGSELQPFEQEFLLIQKYLEISSMRFPDCYEVVYDIDPETLEVEIPPLLIHNFVENIFKHAVSADRKIQIRIQSYMEGNKAVFVVADNGPGMEEKMARDMNDGIFAYEDTGRVHVGIANSWRRIHYFYGDEGKLRVESTPGKGTCFTIEIPKGEEK